jgi:predicted PurR-regulated permease PerM
VRDQRHQRRCPCHAGYAGRRNGWNDVISRYNKIEKALHAQGFFVETDFRRIASFLNNYFRHLLSLTMNRLLQLILAGVLLVAVLYMGRNVLIPLSFALLIACILYPICHWLEARKFSSVAAIAMSMSVLVLLLGALIWMLIWQVAGFSSEWSKLQIKLNEAWLELSQWLANTGLITPEGQQDWISSMQSNYGNEVIPFIKTTAGNLSILVVMLILIPIMAALILFERRRLVNVVHALLPNVPFTQLRAILNETIHAYYQFIKGMAVVYLCVGILNSVGLLILGVPHAILFGFIAAILTFIPYVGIMIGASLPIVVSWITFDSIYYPIGVIAIFTFVQYLEANVIFPWAVSSKLNVNTLMTIIAILAGGVIWGSSGMILFVPFLGILKLISDRMPGWEPLSMLLSGSAKRNGQETNRPVSATSHDEK